jgi:membrane associated rhomboid family serine protease
MFIHGGLLHVASNLICLWIFGDNVEDQMGHGRFLFFYLLCGSMAALAQMLMHGPALPMVGASGAIAGVMGAYVVMFPRSAVYVWVFISVIEIPAGVFLPLWFVMQLLGAVDAHHITGDYGDVAFWAHVGGFLTGAAGVLVFRRPERATVEWLDGATH